MIVAFTGCIAFPRQLLALSLPPHTLGGPDPADAVVPSRQVRSHLSLSSELTIRAELCVLDNPRAPITAALSALGDVLENNYIVVVTTTHRRSTLPTVTSKDGTTIGYDTRGAGPALILVDGATGFRSQGYSNELADLLAPDFTVYSYDRRGRGESGDTQPFAIEREIEDIEALIDAAGGAAYVYGISSGGALALEAAIRLQSKVKKLALYEIPYDASKEGVAAWHTYRAKLSELLAAGQRGDAIALFMSFVGVPEDMMAGMRQSPMWAPLEGIAPTLAYDAAALGADRVPPTERAATVTAQTLVMDGSASLAYMPFMRASAEALTKAIPNAQHQVVEGQSHNVDAKVLAPIMAAFLRQ